LRPKTPITYDESHRFELGKWDTLREGGDVTIVAVGELVKAAVDAADTLAAEGIQARVLNAASLRPMDRDTLLAAAAETGAIVTAEDHFVLGGLGSLVATVLLEEKPVPVEYVGMRDRYGTSGTWEQLLEHFGLTAAAIADAARKAISRKA
jgi:transketolase